ncbi:hypothetical protein [Gloeothece verrucosa]|uniref:hypothetical protein n=1 Tax=Gloeothece verrucosa TaxID=2546359 RepID=UPI00017E2F56|nr:hypothetical protein [Gloeothece verrucosa]
MNLKPLLQQAFQVDKRGLILLTGLDPQTMPLINTINLHQALTATLLQHNQFVTTIFDQYKVSGINLYKTPPYLLLNLLIELLIPEQFYLLLKGKPNPQVSIDVTAHSNYTTLFFYFLFNVTEK